MKDPIYPAGWRPLLRAASLTGAAAVASAALSVVATKIFAAMLGPAEVAVLATLQQIRQAGVTGATLNGQTALVQGASARSGHEQRQFLRTALLLMGTATALVAVLVLAAPGMGGGVDRIGRATSGDDPLAGRAGGVLERAGVFERGAECARRDREAGAGADGLARGRWRCWPIPWPRRSAQGTAADTKARWWGGWPQRWAARPCWPRCSRRLSRRLCWHGCAPARWFRAPRRWWDREAARGFLTMSGSMLASGAAASLVLLAARARILHQQGFAVAGQFDAAWAISMNHVSLVLASLQTYCLPALARTSDRAERSAHLTRMLTAAALAAAAVVCVLALLKPVVLALFYSDAFREASRYLRWTLVGDYLKVSSWVLSIPMLASADMRAFLAADLSAYAVFAAAAAAVGHFRGAAEGTAIAFVLMYAAHLAVCGAIAWRRYEFRPGPRTVLIWTAGLLAVVAVSAAEWRAA